MPDTREGWVEFKIIIRKLFSRTRRVKFDYSKIRLRLD